MGWALSSLRVLQLFGQGQTLHPWPQGWIRWLLVPDLSVEPLRDHIDTDKHRQISNPHGGQIQL